MKVECYYFEYIINYLFFFFKDFYFRILKKGVGINFVYFLCEDFFFVLKIVYIVFLLFFILDGFKFKFGICC